MTNTLPDNPFLRLFADELVEKVVNRKNPETWVQKDYEIEPWYFDFTIEDLLAYESYFAQEAEAIGVGFQMRQIDADTVKIWFYRKKES